MVLSRPTHSSGTSASAENGALPRPRSPSAITLAWLVRLRWGAIVGQVVTIAVAKFGLGLDIPLSAIGLLIAGTAASNVALTLWLRGERDAPAQSPGIVLATDTMVLSGILYFTGGPSNPFSVLYLVYVTLAALVLGVRWAGFLVALAATSYATLFLWNRPIAGMEHAHHGGGPAYSIHLQGMWVAFAITAGLIAFFVARLAAALRDRESELAKAQSLAARSEKLVSLSTLAAGAAHELGTPLGTIAVVSKELERCAHTAPDEAVEDARLIRAEVERCRDILRRMSARAGATMGESPEATTSNTIIALCTQRLGAAGAARLAVDSREDFPLTCPVEGLVQVVVSLLQNAIAASKDATEPVRLFAKPTTTGMCFVVEDHGTGVPSRLLERLGEPFFTTRPPGEGMGLGLFLASAFAERCHGDLRLTSEEGKGTRVELELPLPRDEKDMR